MSETAFAAPRLPTTVADFVVWPGDGRAKLYELVDGVVRAMAPGSTTHGTIQNNLAFVITAHLRASRPSCRLLITPGVVPRLNAIENFRIPDLGVTCTADAPQQFAIPAPLLLVEVMSPSNKAKTWSNVWSYGTIPGLEEILIVQSTRIEAHVLRRSADGTWPDSPIPFGASEDLVLASIGLICPLEEVYRDTHLATAG